VAEAEHSAAEAVAEKILAETAGSESKSVQGQT
jgi:hypothetical protein